MLPQFRAAFRRYVQIWLADIDLEAEEKKLKVRAISVNSVQIFERTLILELHSVKR